MYNCDDQSHLHNFYFSTSETFHDVWISVARATLLCRWSTVYLSVGLSAHGPVCSWSKLSPAEFRSPEKIASFRLATPGSPRMGHQLQHGRHFSFLGSVLRHVQDTHVRDQIIPGIKVIMTCQISQLKPRPNCAGEIWERSFISTTSTVWPSDHTYPSRKRSFSKTLFKPEEFENAGLTF